ncbi:Golgi apparatus protein [Monoraphidium neglectum]|uniref:Golgi apparatus protein n=1 Tax=Monoraphidium neglectum TaxID=145388 RepID=A0A0D2MW52_9CHLO|nr:Golgi apparatus protein [Monoraphidium neglectum]KIY98535.1 Golgi apparatus protein [Monoraphidium neglectum]|eukprot:XP_013897555.1 Golgi apparatus protein [Monoraphidium neglectum]
MMGSARVIRCLEENRKVLTQQCTAALFDHEVRMAEDIDFKYPMRKACAWEISSLCQNVPHGHARVIRCLQEHLDDEDMSRECKDEVTRDTNRAAQDYRLNWRLSKACEKDISGLCSGLCSANSNQPCGGVVLHCLTERQENITSQACNDEVFYYQLMEVNDFRNDVILAEACRADVDKYCKDVEPG